MSINGSKVNTSPVRAYNSVMGTRADIHEAKI